MFNSTGHERFCYHLALVFGPIIVIRASSYIYLKIFSSVLRWIRIVLKSKLYSQFIIIKERYKIFPSYAFSDLTGQQIWLSLLNKNLYSHTQYTLKIGAIWFNYGRSFIEIMLISNDWEDVVLWWSWLWCYIKQIQKTKVTVFILELVLWSCEAQSTD